MGHSEGGRSISAGYTYNENKYDSGYASSDGTAYFPQTPKHLLKLWTMYTLPDEWSKVRLGGGVNFQSSNYQSGSACSGPVSANGSCTRVPYNFTQNAYATVSLRGEYAINDNWSAA